MKNVEKSKIHLGEKILRGFNGAGLSETWIALGTGDGNRICREGCQEAEVEQERTAEEFDVGYYRKLLEHGMRFHS